MPNLSSIKNKIKEKKDSLLSKKKSPSLKMAIFDSIHFVPDAWDQVIGDKNIYLTKTYLRAIENAMNETMDFRYIMFYKNREEVALASFQIIDIASDTLDLDLDNKRKKIGGKLLDQVGLKCLINGTLFGSGETSFYYSDKIEGEEAFDALSNGIQRLYRSEKSNGNVDVLLIKDYLPTSFNQSDCLLKSKYRDFKMEPNMVLNMNESWNTMDDYFASMTSKYRSRGKAAYKKSTDLIENDLNPLEIHDHIAEIQQLFNAVHDKAKYKLGLLNTSSFLELKIGLKDNFILKSYFLGEKMVGFSSIFINGNSLDANYVGLDYEYNRSHAIYQRVLYDLVKVAIERKVEKLNFGRTAGEIKSNLGATSVDMKCYVKHKNVLSNKIIKPLVKRINTKPFPERNPFKPVK